MSVEVKDYYVATQMEAPNQGLMIRSGIDIVIGLVFWGGLCFGALVLLGWLISLADRPIFIRVFDPDNPAHFRLAQDLCRKSLTIMNFLGVTHSSQGLIYSDDILTIVCDPNQMEVVVRLVSGTQVMVFNTDDYEGGYRVSVFRPGRWIKYIEVLGRDADRKEKIAAKEKQKEQKRLARQDILDRYSRIDE